MALPTILKCLQARSCPYPMFPQGKKVCALSTCTVTCRGSTTYFTPKQKLLLSWKRKWKIAAPADEHGNGNYIPSNVQKHHFWHIACILIMLNKPFAICSRTIWSQHGNLLVNIKENFLLESFKSFLHYSS